MKLKLIEQSELKSIIPLVSELNPKVSKSLLLLRLKDMISQGYECLGCYDEESLVGICGLWMQTRFYSGRVIEPDNVYIKEEYRSSGLGSKVMDFIYDLARKRNCDVLELNCYIDNNLGNSFWRKHGFKALGYHYLKEL